MERTHRRVPVFDIPVDLLHRPDPHDDAAFANSRAHTVLRIVVTVRKGKTARKGPIPVRSTATKPWRS